MVESHEGVEMKEMEFTTEMLNKLTEAKNSQGGCRYSMDGVTKSINMSNLCASTFEIYGIPETTGTIKKVRGNWYIYTSKVGRWGKSDDRYKVNEAVRELLGLE